MPILTQTLSRAAPSFITMATWSHGWNWQWAGTSLFGSVMSTTKILICRSVISTRSFTAGHIGTPFLKPQGSTATVLMQVVVLNDIRFKDDPVHHLCFWPTLLRSWLGFTNKGSCQKSFKSPPRKESLEVEVCCGYRWAIFNCQHWSRTLRAVSGGFGILDV